MKMLCILGIGSPFGDDQVGWLVVHWLKQNKTIKKYVPKLLYLACCDRPGLNVFEFFKHTDNVILIDAVKTNSPVGKWQQFNLTEIEQMYSSLSTHNIGIGYSLRLARELGMLPKSIILYGIEIDQVYYTKKISLPVKLAAIQLYIFLKKTILFSLSI